MKVGLIGGLVLWGLLFTLTGCNGAVMKLSAGIERVDTSSTSSQMFAKPPFPPICYVWNFASCNPIQGEEK
jgi:hypothetical protein